MADSSISITAGLGTDVDTRTESTNNQHRQVIVIGDPSTNAGVAPVDATAGVKVDLGDDNDVTVTGDALTALQLIDDAVGAEGAALNKGVLIQGDDGTDRQNVAVDTSGNVQVTVTSVTPPTSEYHGQTTVATAGTAVALASSQALTSGVNVKALAGNTGIVYVGTSGVSSSNGYELSAQESVYLEVDNLADIEIDAATNGEGVCYIGS